MPVSMDETPKLDIDFKQGGNNGRKGVINIQQQLPERGSVRFRDDVRGAPMYTDENETETNSEANMAWNLDVLGQ